MGWILFYDAPKVTQFSPGLSDGGGQFGRQTAMSLCWVAQIGVTQVIVMAEEEEAEEVHEI